MSENGPGDDNCSRGGASETSSPLSVKTGGIIIHCDSTLDYIEYLAFMEKYSINPIACIELPASEPLQG